jgi:uncharacterized protein
MFEVALGAGALVAGAVAAVVGFGIGSLLTPLLALETGTKLAVAAIAIPHFVGSAQRYWMLRQHVDRRVLSAVFGALLVFAALAEFTGWIQRARWERRAAWIAGALSGAFGGLVGNQGGIRSAAMLGFDVPKEAFVATATAIALFVDVARLPVYFATQWREIAGIWPLVAIATLGVIVGTALGTRVLGRLPQRVFRRVIAALLLLLGLYMLLPVTNA